MENKTEILKVIVGSQAHGLADLNSDIDYRGVFIVPTSDILKINSGKIKNTHWIEGNVDDTSWEIGHFLNMATKCNPTILETFLSPVENETEDGKIVRELFPYIWNSDCVRDAFIGYGLNQRKKFLEKKEGRPHKYAVAYFRALFNAYELLTTGTFTIRVSDSEIGEQLKRLKAGEYIPGELIDICLEWEQKVRYAAKRCEKKTDFEQVNAALIKLRYKHW